jgi:hypothetical protein
MGRFLEYDHGRRPSTKKYYPEPHHPSVSLLCKWIFGRMRKTKITNTELNWLYSALIARQPTVPTHLGVLPLYVGYIFETGYYKEPESSPTWDLSRYMKKGKFK